MIGGKRSERWLAVDCRPSAVVLLDDRPQEVAGRLELAGDRDALGVHLEEVAVVFLELVEELETPFSKPSGLGRQEARRHAVEERTARWVGAGPIGG